MRCISTTLSLLAAAFLTCALSSPSVKADTITVANGTQNAMAGIYTYSVTLTNTADVAAGNGFVIYNFPAIMLGGTSFSWSAASAAILAANGDSSSTFSPQISSLYNYVSAASEGGVTPSAPSGPNNFLDNYFHNTLGGTQQGIGNLSLVYSGNTLVVNTLTGVAPLIGTLTGTLTVQTGISGVGATTTSSEYVSLDNGGGIFNGNAVVVASPMFGPGTPVPLPASFVGGSSLFVLLGIVALGKKALSAKQA